MLVMRRRPADWIPGERAKRKEQKFTEGSPSLAHSHRLAPLQKNPVSDMLA